MTIQSFLDDLERRILNAVQAGLPLVERPFEYLARQLELDEFLVLRTLRRLAGMGVLSRVGAVVRAGSVGASTLAAMAVPADRLADVAALVSSFDEVNHNYEREDELNLWFVVTAPTEQRLLAVLAEIAARSGVPVRDLRLEEAYHIDLGFAV
jgi:DNA-binding Lrp family transcriptional regulator